MEKMFPVLKMSKILKQNTFLLILDLKRPELSEEDCQNSKPKSSLLLFLRELEISQEEPSLSLFKLFYDNKNIIWIMEIIIYQIFHEL